MDRMALTFFYRKSMKNLFFQLGFSSLTDLKFEIRERLQMVEEEMRVCLLNFEPRIMQICQKTTRISH